MVVWYFFLTWQCVAADSSPLLLQKNIHLAENRPARRNNHHDLAGKSVYLVMIDRFGREGGLSHGNLEACGGERWCNGTLKGITSHLDYISGMGWDCIWVTPVVKNFYGPDLGQSGYGYHGYWTEDFTQIDPNFGTADDLKELVQETHKHGMCFILDIVLNHIRPIHSLADLQRVKPFNDTSYLHLLNMSGMSFDKYAEKGENWPLPIQALGPGAQCQMNRFKNGSDDGTNSGTYCNNYPGNNYSSELYYKEKAHGPPHLKYCGTGDYLCRGYNETVITDGWFYDLADLDQSHPFVRKFLKDWVKYMATEFDVDGIRLDTTPHLPYDFLKEVQDMLLSLQRPISVLGEVTTVNMSFHASYQSKDGQSMLGGLENFPLTYNAVPGYCGWPNSVLSPVAQFDLSYLASASELQLTSGLYSNTDLLMNMMDNQDDAPIAGLYHVSAGPFSPGTGGCQDDTSLLLNAWAWLMFAKGMPVVAWGDEQGNAEYRMSLWQHGWSRDAWQYRLLSRLNALRRERKLLTAEAQVHFGSKDRFVFQRGAANSKHAAWIFTNNLPNCSGRISYPVAVPDAPRGMYWRDALFNEPFEIFEGSIMAGTKPLVLVLEPTHATS